MLDNESYVNLRVDCLGSLSSDTLYTRVAHGELTREQIRQDAAWRTWRSGARPGGKTGAQ